MYLDLHDSNTSLIPRLFLTPPYHTVPWTASLQAFRRLRKTDNNRIARAVGATVVSRPDEIQESDIGTGCGMFEVRKIGDE